nr:DNA recombination protein RmuC [Mangrovitalea sediminis]
MTALSAWYPLVLGGLLVGVVLLALALWRRQHSGGVLEALMQERDQLQEQLRIAQDNGEHLMVRLREAEQQGALHEQHCRHLESGRKDLESRHDAVQAEVETGRRQLLEQQSRLSRLEGDIGGLEKRVVELQRERDSWQEKCAGIEGALSAERVKTRELEVTLEEERRSTAEKLRLLEQNREALKQEFENLANRIFDQKSERFSEQSKNHLSSLLNPFRDQLADFRKRVDDVYTNETRDREALRGEIKSLQELNRQITEEASNLTKALRGDKKIQGNWGELILEKVLERSGLRKGVEYDTQGSYRDHDGQLLRPDVVVHLPDERHIIIDSKVSLEAYQAYVGAETDELRDQALRAHVEAVRSHIRSLSEKDYSQLHGLHSPDFVLMFMPIEPAFVAAFQYDEKLFADAFERKIVVVTPTTLLATLRTIENIWRYERQSQNARQIADRAGAVYDKLRVFVEHMERLGQQLHTAQGSFDQAMNTLTRGRGNLISQANRFVELGVRVRKELPKAVMDQAEVDVDIDAPVADDRESAP